MAKEETAAAKKASAPKEETAAAKKVFTFVDRGSQPVRKVNVRGHDFHLGKATEVTDAGMIKHLTGHPCFVEGEVDADELLDNQAKAEGVENKKRQRDKKLEDAEKKRNAKFAGKDEGEE